MWCYVSPSEAGTHLKKTGTPSLLTVLETKSPTKPTACTLVCAGEGAAVLAVRLGAIGIIACKA